MPMDGYAHPEAVVVQCLYPGAAPIMWCAWWVSEARPATGMYRHVRLRALNVKLCNCILLEHIAGADS